MLLLATIHLFATSAHVQHVTSDSRSKLRALQSHQSTPIPAPDHPPSRAQPPDLATQSATDSPAPANRRAGQSAANPYPLDSMLGGAMPRSPPVSHKAPGPGEKPPAPAAMPRRFAPDSIARDP